MARGHKIRERIHVWKQSVDFGELLDGRKAVEYRWILKGRRTVMVSVTINKAWLVAKMFSDKFKELTTVSFLTRSDAKSLLELD